MKQAQRSRSRGLILALSASFVFHALLALFLLRAPPPPPAPEHSAVPLEIIITETTRPQAQTPPPEEVLGSDPTLVSLWELELLHGYNTEFRDTSTNFSEALALASNAASSGPSWFKHLRFAGSR
ncbi:MAG: hypothetical protein ACJ8AT_31445 [Hyalangium sp.]|uniref:hypothetical protein n=1 Tax=Hyalangium sp. TaxID=2028555 RepID=UPI00389B2287